MRFAFVSVALLALAHSVTPGVHGAPALAVRQDVVSVLLSTLQNILGTQGLPSSQAVEQLVQKFVQELENPVGGLLPRAPSSTSLTTLSPTTTTSHVLAATTDQIGTSTIRNTSSVSLSTPQASSTPQTRMRRQLPSSLPTSVLSAVLSKLGSQSTPQPVQSAPASALSGVLSKLGSVTLKSATSEPTASNA